MRFVCGFYAGLCGCFGRAFKLILRIGADLLCCLGFAFALVFLTANLEASGTCLSYARVCVLREVVCLAGGLLSAWRSCSEIF